ncbi:SDR family NAD(P)-dependent oxidoreductase, partial [Brucella intermedia]
MNGQFSGKVAVITGSTQGLGAATAKLFAERGAKGLVICGRSAEKGQAQV